MDLAKKEKKDWIFVTNETKEDWVLSHGGRKIGFRPELMEEFFRETGQRIWLANSESFLIAARTAGTVEVAESVIQEVAENLAIQRSTLDSDDKLSSPAMGRKEADRSPSALKLSVREAEQAHPESATSNDADSSDRDKRNVAPMNEKSPPDDEGKGDE